MNKPKVVAVVGTNASGKSALGVRLAGTFDGEIISADSRQVFRGLDLGSGKITPEEMQGVPHYMIDVREPGEFFSMADFQRMSYEKIDEIRARGHLPMIVGGTGLYVDSVLDGYLLSDKEPDLAYRAELEKLTTPALYARSSSRSCRMCRWSATTATASCGCLSASTTATTPCPRSRRGLTACVWA